MKHKIYENDEHVYAPNDEVTLIQAVDRLSRKTGYYDGDADFKAGFGYALVAALSYFDAAGVKVGETEKAFRVTMEVGGDIHEICLRNFDGKGFQEGMSVAYSLYTVSGDIQKIMYAVDVVIYGYDGTFEEYLRTRRFGDKEPDKVTMMIMNNHVFLCAKRFIESMRRFNLSDEEAIGIIMDINEETTSLKESFQSGIFESYDINDIKIDLGVIGFPKNPKVRKFAWDTFNRLRMLCSIGVDNLRWRTIPRLRAERLEKGTPDHTVATIIDMFLRETDNGLRDPEGFIYNLGCAMVDMEDHGSLDASKGWVPEMAKLIDFMRRNGLTDSMIITVIYDIADNPGKSLEDSINMVMRGDDDDDDE